MNRDPHFANRPSQLYIYLVSDPARAGPEPSESENSGDDGGCGIRKRVLVALSWTLYPFESESEPQSAKREHGKLLFFLLFSGMMQSTRRRQWEREMQEEKSKVNINKLVILFPSC